MFDAGIISFCGVARVQRLASLQRLDEDAPITTVERRRGEDRVDVVLKGGKGQERPEGQR